MNFLPFEDVFKDESGGNIKTLQAEFLKEGKVPIVDQGKALIAGFTDDEMRICKSELPVIIFGDHTRCFKFVDFPFAMGADGVKVLKPKIKADEKFLFYYLKSLRLPDAGYDRHFKYLKRTEILMPPLPEQKRIAEVLDKADALREKRRLALQKLDTLLQSVFLEMFGDPVKNPKGWKLSKFGDELISLQYGPRFYNQNYSQDGTRIIRITDLESNGNLDFDSMPRLEVCKEDIEKYALKTGDIIFARSGATVGKTALISEVAPTCIAGAYFLVLRLNNKLHPLYVRTVLSQKTIQQIIVNQSRQSAQQNFSGPGLRRLPLPIPPLELQESFAIKIQKIWQIQKTNKGSLNITENLFQSLQQRAFKGELFNDEFTSGQPQEENVLRQGSLF